MGEIVGSLRTRWTPSEGDTLDALVARGATIAEIARAMPWRSRDYLLRKANQRARVSITSATRHDAKTDTEDRLMAVQRRLVELLRRPGGTRAPRRGRAGPRSPAFEAGPCRTTPRACGWRSHDWTPNKKENRCR